jgi:2-isopropylmalate synthase
MKPQIEIYDTTLRDGSQGEGINFSVADKLRIAEKLDAFGVHYIEGGWPGSNPKDIEFFAEARKRKFKNAKLASFGSTRKKGVAVEQDDQVRLLIEAATPVVTIFGKTSMLHVKEVLRCTPEENLAMIGDTVKFLKDHGKFVIYDAEHCFDGYKLDPEYAIATWQAAEKAGADMVVLCDTNGGCLSSEVAEITKVALGKLNCPVGIHTHDDIGLGVANALVAVKNGAIQVQGTINGYGERTGNCNLTTIIPNLSLKMGIETIPADRLDRLTPVAHHVAELVNMALNPQAPYVGTSAFAHKAGLHVSAIAKRPDAYEHVVPDSVGNGTRFVLSELAGRSTIQLKAKELGLELDGPTVNQVVDTLKHLEHEGYHFEVADASLELLMRRTAGWEPSWFRVESFRVITDDASPTTSAGEAPDGVTTEATIKVWVGEERLIATAEGNGPVNALDLALRQALAGRFEALDRLHLTDYKVRVLDTDKGTGAITRVLLDSTDGEASWTTIGVSENIIEASWQALSDSLVYGLLRAEVRG